MAVPVAAAAKFAPAAIAAISALFGGKGGNVPEISEEQIAEIIAQFTSQLQATGRQQASTLRQNTAGAPKSTRRAALAGSQNQLLDVLSRAMQGINVGAFRTNLLAQRENARIANINAAGLRQSLSGIGVNLASLFNRRGGNNAPLSFSDEFRNLG